MLLLRRSLSVIILPSAQTFPPCLVFTARAMANASVANSGSTWLNEKSGEEFTDKLWKETIQDVVTVDPALVSFASVP